jgi:serine/threonine-protein kinase PknK
MGPLRYASTSDSRTRLGRRVTLNPNHAAGISLTNRVEVNHSASRDGIGRSGAPWSLAVASLRDRGLVPPMTEFDPPEMRADVDARIAAALEAAGFEDVHEIGSGGFGVVFRCRQPSLDRTVAVKVLTTDLDPENVERFIREQRAMGRVSSHPNIVTIFYVGATGGGRPYIVMQFHPHGSLETRIRRYGPLDWGESLHLGVKVAGALEAAHRLGILHRDVKPGNILVTEYGEPQLADFGIARITGGFETATGVITGSPAYTAPEVLRGQAPTARSDIYSLGATLFAAITGHAAYERRSGEQVVAQFLRITSEPIPDLRETGLPDDVCAAIEHAMAGTPDERPATAAELGEELRVVARRNGLSVDDMDQPFELDLDKPGTHLPGSSIEARAAHPSQTRRWNRSVTTPPTPDTKFRPPTSARAMVARTRLLDVLRAGDQRRLVVIHAPVPAPFHPDLVVVAKPGRTLVPRTHRQGTTPWQLQLRARPHHRHRGIPRRPQPRPERTATAESILEKVRRGRVTLEQVVTQ